MHACLINAIFSPLLGKHTFLLEQLFLPLVPIPSSNAMNAFSDKILTKQKGEQVNLAFLERKVLLQKGNWQKQFLFLEVHQKATNIR